MGLAASTFYYLFHPIELRNILRWKIWYNPIHQRNIQNETETQKVCFKFLEQTGRSYSTVIQELHPEVLLPVCVFYLILRGLDTIEDDTSIPRETKGPLLRGFKDIIETEERWSFNGNRAEEKDRELMVQFYNVITEYRNLKPGYRAIVKETTDKMGNGMADYCCKKLTSRIETVTEYDLYCFYVAGLVGEGLTRLFAEAELSSRVLLEGRLYESMGLFLQKTNIIRDVYEDYHDQRRFWPEEIWSKHVTEFGDLFKSEFRDAALNCSSEMVVNALGHIQDCLVYLSHLQEQSIFNFCAIPLSMALATLSLCFCNPLLFEQRLKVTKGDACQLMIESTQDLRVLCGTFRRYVRRIRHMNHPKNPSFLQINIVCGRIEKFTETLFMSRGAEEIQHHNVSQSCFQQGG
ncbi:farnesyl-diphosphate farnesyltransferase [Aspergillus ambiguus]|uniref:farnesyl-diphosphate farnesyltransferase n=1 Tax=Aspergillus ambiguus TaxID=176160 RepID=UPI003CCD0B18